MRRKLLSILALLVMSVTGSWAQTFNVTLKDGTEDAAKWTISNGANSADGTTGLSGLNAGDKVTATYSGTKRVKSVAAVEIPSATDLSMVDNAGADRTSMSTANCYMVHTAGYYKLPLVYGNAIKDGAANTAAYTGVSGSNTTATFPNHAGKSISDPWIKNNKDASDANITVKSAELLWQDAQGLVTKVGIDGDYLTLTVGKDATTQQGNALVAAKDADGNIVWSWHIWVTKETFADAKLTTIATGSHNYKVTPVNLGWVPTSDDGKQGYNTYYQWGRKDAFIPGTWNANTNRTVYDISNTDVTGLTYEGSTTPTIADNIKNPTTHYYYSSTGGPCNTSFYNMWDAKQTGTDNITTATVKTVYDPCPAGFCVPTSNLYYFMWNISITGPELWFPASGYRRFDSGMLCNVGGVGYLWPASAYGTTNARHMSFYSNDWGWNKNVRSFGFSVRAVAEEVAVDYSGAALGDIFYSDGTYSSTLEAGKTPIGVIAYLDQAGTDDDEITEKSNGGGHGLVLCLKNAASGEGTEWYSEPGGTEKFEFSDAERVSSADDLKRNTYVSGLTNTNTLAGRTNASNEYKAAYNAKNYTGLAAPEGTTGWFLPSAQQWVKMMAGLGALSEDVIKWDWNTFDTDLTAVNKWENAIKKVGDGNYESMIGERLIYVSSSEVREKPWDAVVMQVSTGTGAGCTFGGNWKRYREPSYMIHRRVRPVLAF